VDHGAPFIALSLSRYSYSSLTVSLASPKYHAGQLFQPSSSVTNYLNHHF